MSASKIYSAVYSSIPVYEMIINGIAAMRRSADSYMNATQILKVAGIEKGRRTRILEREVLIGEHEKVQGGYGKYQGTWIPFEKGKELAERYKVYDSMLPLFEFDPATSKKDLEELPTKEQASAKRRNQDHKSSPPSSPTSVRHSNKKQKSASAAEKAKVVKPVNDDPHHEHHRSILMNIFLTDDPNYTPNILTSSLLTHDINIDLVIDEQGHTALHWASALGRPKVVDLLISNGANVCRVNYDGQTPLMRSVMITCAYENKCFPELVEMMQDAVSIIDNQGRTVLHHIALTAGVQGYSDAATYYMKHLLSGLSSNGKLRQIINIKDKNHSESVMGIAIRLECEEIINLLSAYGAIDPLIPTTAPELLDFTPTFYPPSAKTAELTLSIQRLAQTFEEERNKQLYDKDKELHEAQNEIRMVRYQLEEAQRRLELPSSMQLAEARLRIQQLENQSYTGESERNHIELDEPIDDIPGESKTPREKRLEKKVKVLMAQLDASNKINNELKDKLNKTLTHTNEREMQCKRLIAAGCNLPIEKVDSLIEPLTLAIESDPPDLDMTRVIGFMERLKSQPSPNGFRQPASPIYSPHDSTSTPV